MDKLAVPTQSVAIPFIMFTIENGFKINDEAVEFLTQIKGKVGIIAICGKYRTGKSYILNKLFMEQLAEDRAKRGFQVGPTINPCTKGLWIWKEIFYAQNDEDRETPIIIIDTEGLGAFDEDDNHDTKIFLLALLLSSLLIYNSVGSIDENVLNNLSLVVNLSKTLQIKNDQKAEDPDELAEYFPSFLWILRDFALRLIDQDGNQISSKQYLENSLKEQKGVSDAIENKNRIRRLIKHFFKDRDCQTLVRPIEEEQKLQTLNTLKNSDLRAEFVEQINNLRSKIFKKVKPKLLKNQIINGPMLIELAEAYVKALNGGKVPTIENAWNYMQASELDRAFKEVIAEYDTKIKTAIEKSLPLNEDKLKDALLKGKQEALVNFKAKVLGDINNSKGQEYQMKLKKEIKTRQAQIEKKNTQVTRDECIKILESCVTQNIKAKVMQNLYKSYSDLKFDFEQLRNETLQTMSQGFAIKEHVYEFLFNKSLQLTEDFLSDRENNSCNTIRILQEKLKTAEHESLRYKQELNHEKEQCFTRLQDGESDRIKYKTENAILTERLQNAKAEIDELRMKLNCEYTEKMQDLELQNKVQKEELRKKDNEIVDLTNETIKNSNDHNKRFALIEQEREFLRNDLNNLKESIQRKDLDLQDLNKQIRDKEEKIKSYRQKKKLSEKEAQDYKSQKDKFEQQILTMQPINNNVQMVDSSQLDFIKKELENVKLEKVYLQNQLLTTQSQKDENKRLYEALLNVINNNQLNGGNQNKENQAKNNKTVASSQEMIERLCQMQSKMLDLEQSNQVLRNFKNLYKSASEVKCGGCSRSFKPVLFKAHYLKCTKLIEDQLTSGESTGQDRLFIKFIDSESGGQQLRFFVSQCGLQWYVKFETDKLQETVRHLQRNYHSADFFKSNLFKKFLNVCDSENSSQSPSNKLAFNDVINQVIQELSSLYVIKKDQEFRSLFQIDDHISGDNTQNSTKSNREGTVYVSFMSQANNIEVK
ncbi:guanylate-binding n-terminal domain containing protein [Stylonychia lemnae]|uniref:Guanylate-binding n-terminal domain containing protein n=1 Tax=Stylonychia lemnae TaxID=5949 RepID=A0A078ANG6_STYLE|nr:guanylate-binding n-terminal domain containing protein [Stylonychia lemnae]|eukprot:CDW83719.1 guanylate-binding n-terminal domain containing protein [Stylonychia lemnae]